MSVLVDEIGARTLETGPTWLKDCGATNAGTDALREQDLVVLGAETGHHDAKDV